MRRELIRPFTETLARHAAERPDKVAVRDLHSAITYAELYQRMEAGAAQLTRQGVRKGVRVGIATGNTIGMVAAYLAILRTGAVAVPAIAAASADEVSFLLADSGAVLVVSDAERLDVAEKARGDTPLAVLPEAPEADPTVPASVGPSEIDELAFILYTSGTTGQPKGVRLSQRNLLWAIASAWVPVMEWTEDELVLSPIPLAHVYGLATMLGVLCVGASAVVLPRFSPTDVLSVLDEHDVTVLLGVPTHYDYLLRTMTGPYRRGTLRICSTGAAPLPPALLDQVEAAFGARLLDGYGATETSTALTLNSPATARRGSVGRAVEGVELRIVDVRTGLEQARGVEGEVVARSPGVMLGYHRRPQEQAAVLRDGWYHTGDLGVLDADGFLTLTGRTKDIIIRGGENIAPREIETLVNDHPSVVDSAVVGIAHPSLGEVPVLVVVGAAGVDPDALTAELHDLCSHRLAPFKVPDRVVLTAQLPRSPTGKLLRTRLRRIVEQKPVERR